MKYILALIASISCSNFNTLDVDSFRKTYTLKNTITHVDKICGSSTESNCVKDEVYRFQSQAEILYLKYDNDLNDNAVCVLELDRTNVPTNCDLKSNRLVYLRQLQKVESKLIKIKYINYLKKKY